STNCSLLRVLTKKPTVAQAEEIQHNPRARSAKLRFAERLELSTQE
ncbi:16S rRNA (cytosine(1402)-N(4))-methyltransferase, partial [Moorena sp. SIO2C4]